MTVVADSSPLITLTKIGRLDLLNYLYQTITITPQVYDEVVVRGSGLAGSAEIAACKWIEVKPIENVAALAGAQKEFGLGVGETSVIVLGREVRASLVLIDEIKARKAAREHGLAVLGCVGILEDAFGLHLLSDLALAYRQLVSSGAYVDHRILENSLKVELAAEVRRGSRRDGVPPHFRPRKTRYRRYWCNGLPARYNRLNTVKPKGNLYFR